jgi:sodium-dependent dicarboxylate transporter 2/3/5
MLGIAYSASIGGLATLIGSPPNAIFAGIVESSLDVDVTFLAWFVFAGPLSLGFLVLTWLLLVRLLSPDVPPEDEVRAVILSEHDALGPISRAERRMLWIFALVAAGWLLRPFLLEPLFPAITDTVIAVTGGVLLFVVPADFETRRFLLDWNDAARLPWGVLLLLGAGILLANAFQESGLDTVIARGLAGFADVPLFLFCW